MAGGVEVDTRELDRELRGIEKRATNYDPILPVLAEILVSYVSDEFETAGRGRWRGLEPSTLRKRRGSSAQILKDTGRLAASIRAEWGPGFVAAVTDTSYAVFHVSDEARSKIPLRDFFDVLDLAEPDIADELETYIAGAG